MSYGTDRKNTPQKRPELYRPAQFSDITNVNVRGFYTSYGTYWRKNGMSKTWKRSPHRACVPVKFGIYAHGRIDETNFHNLFVRLSEVVAQKLTGRIQKRLSGIIQELKEVEGEQDRGG